MTVPIKFYLCHSNPCVSEFLRGKVLRHFYHERKQTTIKPLLLKYTYIVTNNYGGKFELPPLPQLKELSVIVTTIEQSGDLAYYPGLEPGHFTHIFIDEAAQVRSRYLTLDTKNTRAISCENASLIVFS